MAKARIWAEIGVLQLALGKKDLENLILRAAAA